MHSDADDIARLISFPEQNPNPVIEITTGGRITYLNPAANNYFPDLQERQISHPVFFKVRERIQRADFRDINNFVCEVCIQEHYFEQKLFHISKSGVVRVYCSDITEQKRTERRLASLALFPEQNPNLVIEADLSSGRITYMNPSARNRFPEIEEQHQEHPFFTSVSARIRSGKDFECEVIVDHSVYEQKIYFIPDSTTIRIYSTDITRQKETEKNLSRLASFPEQNPSPIIELGLNGEITYTNPACRATFSGLLSEKLEHPVMQPLKSHFRALVEEKIRSYEEEIFYDNAWYIQRGKLLEDDGVIRIFNIDITDQKRNEAIIAEKNKDITDSINYSKRIQQAILPLPEDIHQAFGDAFVLYQPKDIISGDFYWYSFIDGVSVIACADCTGHGVPGALMSMIGSNLLTHIVNDSKVSSPGAALRMLDSRIRKVLRQDDTGTPSRDGMDIALCAIHKETRRMQYAGANRPLVMIRKDELTEYSSTKFPIGGHLDLQKVFNDHTIELQDGDALYIFSDGYADQFGGPRGKKMLKRNFYQLLTEISHLPMNDQKVILEERTHSWRGNLEQVDDVLVIGIRFAG